MRTILNISRFKMSNSILLILISVLGLASTQAYHKGSGAVTISIEGTSNIHDWSMTSSAGKCNITFEPNSERNISHVNFSIPVTTIKSESNAMDKNAYKALKSAKFPVINFTSDIIRTQVNANGSLHVTAKGNLMVSGVTKTVLLTANATKNQDNSVTYTGSIKLKMTDFEVQPPSIMMGAIRTGDEITVKYNFILRTENQ